MSVTFSASVTFCLTLSYCVLLCLIEAGRGLDLVAFASTGACERRSLLAKQPRSASQSIVPLLVRHELPNWRLVPLLRRRVLGSGSIQRCPHHSWARRLQGASALRHAPG